MKINVTQDHIRFGGLCSCHFCPIALAIKDALPDSIVTVQIYCTFINGVRIDFSQNTEVTNFISDFDNSIQVEPFSFDLDHENP